VSLRRHSKGSGSILRSIGIVLGVLLLGFVGFLAWKLGAMLTADARANRGRVTSVPAVIGLTLPETEAALKAAGLKAQKPIMDYSDTMPKGQVFRQDPAAGELVKPGKQVQLRVSMGPAKFVVPELSGLALKDVPAALAQAGLLLGQVTKIYDPGRPEGQVINQDPPPGTEFSSSAAVDITVSAKGELPAAEMPALTGLSLIEAERILDAPELGLRLALVEYVANDAVNPGTVLQQSIDPGRKVRLGDSVELEVGIPSLLKQQAARRVTISLKVPLGPEKQSVRVVVSDALGEKVDYEMQHKPGDMISRSIDIEGEAVVKIYLGGAKEPYREERL
jgi:serine/threonine-protein kinase